MQSKKNSKYQSNSSSSNSKSNKSNVSLLIDLKYLDLNNEEKINLDDKGIYQINKIRTQSSEIKKHWLKSKRNSKIKGSKINGSSEGSNSNSSNKEKVFLNKSSNTIISTNNSQFHTITDSAKITFDPMLNVSRLFI